MIDMTSCSICGGSNFAESKILWPALIEEWELRPNEVEYIDRQQGTHCVKCNANLRIIALGQAIQDALPTTLPLCDYAAIADPEVKVLDINGCVGLSAALQRMPGYLLANFPEVDMCAMPFADGSFDLVVHSDTLEHVPDPLRGLQECYRILKPGGRLCFTIPIVVGRMTRDRANLPKSYHGNPQTRTDDFIVQTEFGADAWTLLMRAGFDNVALKHIEHPAAHAITAWRKPVAESTLQRHWEMELLAAQEQIHQGRLQCEQLDRELSDLRAENRRLIANVESLRSKNAMPEARTLELAGVHNSLLEETHRLWRSSSWRLLRPVRNLIRSLHGYDRETEPIPASQAEALRTIIAIRDSLSWELTAPLRIVHRVLSPRSAPPASPVKSKWEKADFLLIKRDADFDLEFFLPPSAPRLSRDEAIEGFMRGWTMAMGRKPYSGFNPQIYAELAMKPKEREKRNPLAHFIENAKPAGPWLIPLIRESARSPGATRLRTAILVHAYYPELMEELLRGLSGNASKCDLFVTTSRQEDLERLKHSTASYDRGDVRISIVPNRGRDIGPFVTEYAWLSEKYELVGHLHTKKTPHLPAEFGQNWRKFLWQNLVGGGYPMMDLIAKHFEDDPHLGLVFPDDPHVVGWMSNKDCAARLAKKMGLAVDLPQAFEFPVGTMFWCRGAALQPLFELGLTWDDYPLEPVPIDGTILHAVERLLPFIAQHQGYRIAATHVAGIGR